MLHDTRTRVRVLFARILTRLAFLLLLLGLGCNEGCLFGRGFGLFRLLLSIAGAARHTLEGRLLVGEGSYLLTLRLACVLGRDRVILLQIGELGHFIGLGRRWLCLLELLLLLLSDLNDALANLEAELGVELILDH